MRVARHSDWSVEVTRIFFAGVVLVGLLIVYAKSRFHGMSVIRAIGEVVVTGLTSFALSLVVLLVAMFL